jgi:hypothetical protein
MFFAQIPAFACGFNALAPERAAPFPGTPDGDLVSTFSI